MRFLLLAILPFLVDAAHNPPYLRHHKRVIEQQQQARAVDSPRAIEGRSNAGHASAHKVIKRVVQKRGQQCRPKATTTAAAPSTVASAVATVAPSSAVSPAAWSSEAAQASSSWVEPSPSAGLVAQENWAKGKSSSPAPAPTTTAATTTSAAWSAPSTGSGGNSGGLLQVTNGQCGYCQSSNDSPNGADWWLNCGVDEGGWNPPHVTVDQLIAADLTPNGIFAPCANYIGKFKQYAAEFKVPPIMLASFAMQESTCNAGATGGNGEAGLMQIAPPNCNAPSGTSCWDVDYNIRRGAELLSQMISHNGGNVIAAVGAYNGWQKGMTVNSATAAKWQGHCFAQNNLDYLTQFFNGWMQNKNGYNLGKYFNLRGC